MRERLFQIISRYLLLWIILGLSIEQTRAQGEYNPTLPPEPGQLSVRLTSDPSGVASFEQTDPSGSYNAGTEVTVRAYPNLDYEFVAWQSEDGETLWSLSEYTFPVTANTHLVAKMRFNPSDNPAEPGGGYYNVIATAQSTMSGWVEQSGQGIYKEGKEVVLTAHAYSDYEFSHWETNGESVSEESTYCFIMPAKHVYMLAVYKWNPVDPSEPGTGCSLYLNLNDSEAGYVSQSGSGVYALGDQVTVVASPYRGYTFTGWYEGDVCLSTSISYMLTIGKRVTLIEARFNKVEASEEPEVTVEIGIGENPDNPTDSEVHGSVMVEGLPVLGQRIRIIAKPEDGYAFEGWYLNGEFLPDAEMDYTILIEKNMKKLESKFRKLPVRLEVKGGLKSWALVTRYRDDIISLMAEPVENYTFMGWYLQDQLLSKAWRYDFNVRLLRTVLPAISAVYTVGSVDNDIVTENELIDLSFSNGLLCIISDREIFQIRIYAFDGSLLGNVGSVKAGSHYRLFLPSCPLIVWIEMADGKRIVRKLCD